MWPRILTFKIPPPDQKLFQIPNLGTHYKEIWHQEDQVELQEIQQQVSLFLNVSYRFLFSRDKNCIMEIQYKHDN